MEELKILDNTILIVMDEDKEKVIQYFSEKKRRHAKIFTLSEFMNQYYFSYDERAIYYLKCHYRFQYDVSLMYLSLLYDVIDTNILDEKVRMVQEIKRELEEHHLLFFHPYFREYLEDKEILFFDVFFDSRAQKLYSDLEKNFKVSKFYLERENYNREVMYEFSDIETEVVYVASSILEKIKGGTLPSQIKLCGVTGEYLPVVKRVFSWFSLPLNLSDNYLYGTVMGQDFLALLESDIFLTMDSFSKKYTLKQKEEVEIFEMICDIVNRYSWVDDYLEVRDFLIHDFKRAKIKENVDSNAIEVLSHLRNVRDDSIVFLLGFNQGLIPKLKRDEGYFNDTLKKKLGLFTTGDENKLEKERWLQEISHVKNLVITSKKKSPLGDFYLSSLNDDLKMRVEEGKITYLYSDLYNQLMLGEKLDTLVKYNEREDDLDYLYQGYRDIPYLTYDSSFTGINKEKLREYLKGKFTLSYSAMNSYYQCGFRYYLSNILKLNLSPYTFYTILGNIFHEVLSCYKRSDFDFDLIYDRVVEKYGEVYSYDARERFFLKNLKGELKFILDTILEQEEFNQLEDVYVEERVVKNYQKDSYEVCFKGFVDKMLVSSDKKFISIIDYKTGNPNLNLNDTIYGLDLQLPIYLFLAKNKFSEARIIGFYLQKILNNEIKRDNQHSYLELKKENLKLQGYSNSDTAILSLFDNGYFDSKVIKGMKMTSKGIGTKKVLDDFQMENLSALAEVKIKEAIQGIIDANFSINPKRIGNDNVGCKYCLYRDICFMSEKDIVDLEEYKNLEFLEGENT